MISLERLKFELSVKESSKLDFDVVGDRSLSLYVGEDIDILKDVVANYAELDELFSLWERQFSCCSEPSRLVVKRVDYSRWVLNGDEVQE